MSISFFGDDETAATDRIWELYLRDSIDRGFSPDTRSRMELDLPPSTEEEHEDMSEQKTKRGELKERVLETARAFESVHGRMPSAKEVFEQLGAELGKNVANVRMCLKRLVQHGELSPGHLTTEDSAYPDPPVVRKPARPKQARIVDSRMDRAPRAQATGSSDALIAMLEARRARAEAEVQAIDAMLKVLR